MWLHLLATHFQKLRKQSVPAVCVCWQNAITQGLLCIQDGIELSSADVNLSTVHHKPNEAAAKGKGKQVLQRQTTDEFMAADTALDIDDVQPQVQGSQAQSKEERRKHFEGQGWSDVALRDK